VDFSHSLFFPFPPIFPMHRANQRDCFPPLLIQTKWRMSFPPSRPVYLFSDGVCGFLAFNYRDRINGLTWLVVFLPPSPPPMVSITYTEWDVLSSLRSTVCAWMQTTFIWLCTLCERGANILLVVTCTFASISFLFPFFSRWGVVFSPPPFLLPLSGETGTRWSLPFIFFSLHKGAALPFNFLPATLFIGMTPFS